MHDEPPVEVVYEQGYSVCTVEKLPRRKRGVKVVQHCRRVVVVVKRWVLFHSKLLSLYLALSVKSPSIKWIRRVHTGIWLLIYP